jgi:hypothetical protein
VRYKNNKFHRNLLFLYLTNEVKFGHDSLQSCVSSYHLHVWFFGEFIRLFAVVCMGFHEDYDFHPMCSPIGSVTVKAIINWQTTMWRNNNISSAKNSYTNEELQTMVNNWRKIKDKTAKETRDLTWKTLPAREGKPQALASKKLHYAKSMVTTLNGSLTQTLPSCRICCMRRWEFFHPNGGEGLELGRLVGNLP